MKKALLDILCCPKTGMNLVVEDCEYIDDEIHSGVLSTPDGKYKYSIREGIPRFVPESNYADNFGMQWNKFSKTQLDSYSGCPVSTRRFWLATNWRPEDINDKWLLDVGCGAGRFSEVALGAGAIVVAVDFSSAVDACYRNLQKSPGLHVVQADIYHLPFRKRAFDFVYSLGVLQHTPDVKKSFFSLPPMIVAGGKLCVDFYEKSWKSALLPKYWLRPITKRVSKTRLFSILEFMVPGLLVLSRAISKIPIIGRQLKRIVPVANYYDELPLDDKQQKEWALLDTFDWLSPEFDNPQTSETVLLWFREAKMENVEVLKAGHLVGRGTVAIATPKKD